MTKLKRTLLLIASTCLILLLAASFAIAEDVKLPSDDTIISTLTKVEGSKVKETFTVSDKFKNLDGSYKIFLVDNKDKNLRRFFTLIPLTSGKWKVGYFTYGGYINFYGKTIE